jgi:hypothetical protein
MLTRAPARLRRATFAPLAAVWLRGALVGDDDGAPAPVASREEQGQRTHGRATPTGPTPRGVEAHNDVPGSPPAPVETRNATRRDDSARVAHVTHEAERETGSERGGASLSSVQPLPSDAKVDAAEVSHADAVGRARVDDGAHAINERDDARNAVASSSRVATGTETESQPASCEQEFEAQIETGHGGLFFLVNLALFLELYGDFTAPAAPCLPLHVWDFVALVGRELAGARVESDPVWPLLARLAGRDARAEPGEGFAPPDEWRISVEWLKSFPREGDWLWSAARGRLRVRHPAGFFVIDVALARGASRAQLARELRPYRAACPGFTLRRAALNLHARGRDARARWLWRLMEYVRARLWRALGVEGRRELSRLLCERTARVFVTATHVDVVMRLAELPVEIRFAGLDRDPGWLPAAGRHVAFHFE